MLFQPISPHNHPLWHLDRFLDEKTEQQYCERAIPWGLAALRLQCLVAVLLNIYNIVVYSNLVEWWAPLIALLASVAIILASRFSVGVQQNSFALHSVFACFLVGVQCYIGWKQATEWSATDLNRFVIVRSQLSGSYLTPLEELSDNAVDNWGYIAFVDILISCWNQWVTLSLAGMNRWGFGALAVILAALLSTAYTSFGMETGSQLAILFTSVMFSFFSFCIGIAVDRARRLSFLSEKQLTQELQASQMADSILNHTLKNILADVSANLEIFLEQRTETALLEDAIQSLRRGISSCKERQVYLQLVAGEYVPQLTAVNLREFGQQLVAGRSVTSSFCDIVAIFDNTLLNLIIENAISNAFKHGRPKDPDVHFVIDDITTYAQTAMVPGCRKIQFSVSNAVHPDRPPLTPDTVRRLFAGQAHLVSNTGLPTLSDRIGLTHCVLAAELGGITLDLAQTEDTVIFSATATMQVMEAPMEAFDPKSRAESIDRFPPGLVFFCLEDSAASRRLLEFHLGRLCQPKAVRCLGASEDEVDVFVAEALQEADVVIVDQHLQYGVTHYGTDVVQRLLLHGYTGLVCIRSANNAPEDCAFYMRHGAHCVLGKDLLGSSMVEELKASYIQKEDAQLGCHGSLSLHRRCLPPGSVPDDDQFTSSVYTDEGSR